MTQATLLHPPPALSVPKGLRMTRLNEVRLSGRLTQNPKIRAATPRTVIVQLNLAVNRHYQTASGQWRQEVTFVPITAFDSLARYSLARLRIGCPLYVQGRLRSDRWKTDHGLARCALKVEATKMQCLERNGSATLRIHRPHPFG